MMVRLGMFFVFSCLVAFAAHLFFGSIIFAQEAEGDAAIVLRDQYANEVHDLSGMVMVPSDCHDLTVRAKDVDARVTAIVLETWEQPYRIECSKEPTPRAIHAVAFGPATLEFRGLMDGEWVPLKIVRE